MRRLGALPRRSNRAPRHVAGGDPGRFGSSDLQIEASRLCSIGGDQTYSQIPLSSPDSSRDEPSRLCAASLAWSTGIFAVAHLRARAWITHPG